MKGTPYADRPARLNGKRGPSERAWCPWGWPMHHFSTEHEFQK
jgi:hypothetical protein